MNSSRLLLSTRAVFLLAIGLTLNFAPSEIADRMAIGGSAAALVLQLAAGALMGLGVINWMSRGNAMGGIYARPLCMGNLLHFAVAAFALIRVGSAHGSTVIWTLSCVYGVFALSFGYFAFGFAPARAQGERG